MGHRHSSALWRLKTVLENLICFCHIPCFPFRLHQLQVRSKDSYER